VMELVEGLPIDLYCDSLRLDRTTAMTFLRLA